MKTITRVLLLALIVVVLSQCKKDTLPSAIPDKNFLNALIERGVDKNGDGIISTGEAAEVTFLDVSYCSISDLKGIEAFINLDSLYCNYNKLTSLDFSNNTTLTGLNCSWNELTSLDVSKNTALTYLECSANRLTSLDVSNNTALTYLECGSNQLTSLDVSNNAFYLFELSWLPVNQSGCF